MLGKLVRAAHNDSAMDVQHSSPSPHRRQSTDIRWLVKVYASGQPCLKI